MSDDARIGTMLAHYRVDAVIGRGGMGVVYRGWDTALERPVALKLLTTDGPEARARMVREARAQAKVHHPNVVPIHFVGEHEGQVFLAMELVDGSSLAERIGKESLGIDASLAIADELAKALATAAERGLVHRDVKPSNVLCTRDGRVLLADFGLAKAVGSDDSIACESTPQPVELTRDGAIVGTPAYMAPEQSRARSSVDHRADIYALGVTLYELFTGQRPFTSEDSATLIAQHRSEDPLAPRTLRPDLPPQVESIVLRAMAKDPDQRFASYDELRAAIANARVKPRVEAGGVVRTVAFGIDLILSAIVASLVAEVAWPWLAWPAIAIGWAIVEARFASSAGKALLSLRIVGPHDAPMRPLAALVRNATKHWGPIVLAASLPNSIEIALGLAWLLGLALAFGPRHRTLHDRASRTRVVYALE